jgi:uncharacterized protein
VARTNPRAGTRELVTELRAGVRNAGGVDRRVLVVAVVASLCLTTVAYYGTFRSENELVGLVDGLGFDAGARWLDDHLNYGAAYLHNRLVLWAAANCLVLGVVPAIAVRVVLRERLSGFGCKLGGALRYWRVYALAFAVISPVLVVASLQDGFQATYPMYRIQRGQLDELLRWEALYIAQFAAIEFFFRGFLVHGLRPRLGFAAVPVATIPYCMLHFGKPVSETIAAIGAGLFLGTLSYVTRSIWLGIALHAAVAVSIDLLALWHLGLIG